MTLRFLPTFFGVDLSIVDSRFARILEIFLEIRLNGFLAITREIY